MRTRAQALAIATIHLELDRMIRDKAFRECRTETAWEKLWISRIGAVFDRLMTRESIEAFVQQAADEARD
jgi:hypothetical protein